MYEIIYQEIEEKKEYEEITKKVLTQCFKEEGLKEEKLSVTITLTTKQHIKKLNKEYRNIDKPTDVLSFPMFEKGEIKDFPYEDILGDIVICIEKVEEQAKEYGHSFEREFSYMLVHGFYHLMGYDHIQEEDKKEMRTKEEKILTQFKRKEKEKPYEK